METALATSMAIAFTLMSAKFFDLEYWCKWIVSYLYIKFSRRLSKKRFDLYDMSVEHDPYKVGFLPPPIEITMESPLTEGQLEKTNDQIFFYGVNSKSESLTVRLSRLPDDRSESHVQLRLSDGRTYELKETEGWQQSCCEPRVFSCGDLQAHYLSPMRRWRIYFNGLMREKKENEKVSEKYVHVKFALLWRASSDIFDFTTDINVPSIVTAFARTKWNHFLPPLEKLNSALDIYNQAGVILGNVSIEGQEANNNLYLFGGKMRSLGDKAIAKDMEIFQVMGWISSDGRFVHLVETSIANVVEKLRFGFVVQPTSGIEVIYDAAILLEKPDKGKSNSLSTRFQANGDPYLLEGKLVGEEADFETENEVLRIDHLNTELNSLKGKGIILKSKTKTPSKRASLKKTVSSLSTASPFVVSFLDKTCQEHELTGGKGSSLGKLTELSKEFQGFIVPEGIVVTTASYKKFLSREVIQEIKNLENCLYNNNTCEEIKIASQKVVEKVIQSAVPEEVHQDIVSQLQKIFPSESMDSIKFAVRSSATGEDTEQMSAAGQMDTYLGVMGIDEIMTALKKCWASQFGLCAVQYKRQNGQPLNCPMAVVVQQMVSCDVAGVLFTCDPLTGDPTKMSVTANYGLGESVVSGSEEPDTIELKRSKDDKLVIESKLIGSKERRIVVNENQEGTDIEEVPESERSACCLRDEDVLRLGELALKLQKKYRSHRDLEWGFWKNNLYIFQSRPVTSGKAETDFEIDHEMDAPLRVENDVFTVSNVGEVMPGAMSPLGSEVLLKYIYIAYQRPNYGDLQDEKRTKYVPTGMVSMSNHTMFSCIHLLRKADDKATADMVSVAIFGRIIDDEELLEMAKTRFACLKITNMAKIKENLTKLYYMLYGCKRRLKMCRNIYDNFKIPVENYRTSQEMFDALMYGCTDLVESFGTHFLCSEASSIWNIIIFSILKAANGELNADVYTDFSKLLTSPSSSEVESADVPSAIEEISDCISKAIKPEEFKNMETDEALDWLQSTKSQAGIKYREFIHKHGHRCLREFDIHSKTWLTDPSTLIQILQNKVGKQNKDKIENGTEDYKALISSLKTPLKPAMSFLMKMLIPMSRKSVQNRECTKSLAMRGLNEWRKGYNRLARLMVKEGRIPDEDLLFFMTVEDIKELLETRSPRVIARANHRRRRHPVLDKYIFPEISKGVPVPINMDNQPVIQNDGHFSMKGIPVSQGVARGFVRVAITLEEASLLQSGEILVTYSTDIGWSPYFPMLAGVVTELGGLISHGAVVSREYGLPCIAGLHGATRQFQTGDYAFLDGNTGILHKLPNPENL
ncbi:hypothetical protein JTE90_021417 [Oedothorax gibbosus]|uniref:Phosphoenolpyruvate synthase n=1 Tax=Oedothorax gibbosus TaxID=931172 RepID=A0AAV6VGW4_9ARAC|nr:hypothetical protein JTE90_021417 [Oedothorax gibbosus]